MSLRGHIAFLLLAVICLGGCALWNQPESSEPSKLPLTSMAPDTVVLEIAFVRMSGDALVDQESLWREIDELRLPAELRVRMHENGLRAGVVGSQLPPLLRHLLEEKADPLGVVGPGYDSGADVTASQRKLDCRAGKRGVILAGRQREKLTLLMQKNGQVTGQDFADAQCLFAVKTWPGGDGRVRLELVPEIEHGNPKQRWVGQEGTFHAESSKEHKVLENLKMDLFVSPGDVFVVTCTPDHKGLGKQFFADSKPGEQKLMLIRLAQTQHDDLFAPEALQKPIATPAEH